MSEVPFKHETLDFWDIRLVQITSDIDDEVIACSLQTYRNEYDGVYTISPSNSKGVAQNGQGSDTRSAERGVKVHYAALSYTWGPPTPVKKILINGEVFFVRQNLHHLLAKARGAAERPLIWIDQLCIDQDNIKERNEQVSRMRQIYRNADTVFAWLGPSYDDSNHIMSFIASLSVKDISSLSPSFGEQTSNPWNISERTQSAARALFSRTYWSRLWIIQEVLLGCNLKYICGDAEADGHHMERFVQIQFNSTEPEIVGVHAPILYTTRQTRYLGRPLGMDVPVYNEAINENGWYGGFKGLLYYVYLFCHFQCQDPRDKIYGLAGIASWDHQGYHETPVDIDYAQSVDEVFKDLLRIGIMEDDRKYREDHSGLGRQDWNVLAKRLKSQMGISTAEDGEDLLGQFEEEIGIENTYSGHLQRIREAARTGQPMPTWEWRARPW